MRFKDYLREEEQEDYEYVKSLPPLKTLINVECPGLLKRMGNNGLLYRGVTQLGSYEGNFSLPESKDPITVYRKKVRKDRIPMSMNADVSRALDKWFEKNFSFRARSQAIFVFGERGRGSAEGYGGKKCIVFPIGKFSYVWSPNVDDLYSTVDGKLNKRREIHPDFDNGGGGMDTAKLDDYMKPFKYTNNHLDKAIQTDHEIMIDCDEVLLIEYYSNSKIKEIYDALL